MILIASDIAQKHGGTVILRDQQIGRTIVVVITGDDGAGIFELNLVETNIGGDVFETIRSEIAKQPHFAFAFFRFADGDQIDPAVVVVVDGGDAKGADPISGGKFDAIKSLAVVVPPQYQTRFARLRKRNVHPAVVVKVQHRYAVRPAGFGATQISVSNKLPFTRIFVNDGI